MESYFSEEQNILNRFFFIFGKTNDCFCDDNLIDSNLKHCLNKHLKDNVNGYERVIFYSRDRRIHFYDDESFNLATEREVTTLKKKSVMRLSGPLKSRMKSTVQSGKQPDKSDEKAGNLHFDTMPEERAFDMINTYMKDNSVKTAVVITNTDDFINFFGESQGIRNKILDSFNKYNDSDNKSENIMIFIFPSQASPSVYNENGGGTVTWRTFFKPKLENGMITEIHIPPPSGGEVRNAINHIRLKYGLKVNFLHINDICKNIEKSFYAEKPSFHSLNELMMKLKKLSGKKITLDNERIDIMLGTQDKETAFQKLDRLLGMGNFKTVVETLKKQAERDKPTAADTDFKSRLLPPERKTKVIHRLHCKLTGNPGTGKTTVAKLLGEIFYELGYLERGHTVKVTRDDLVAGYQGQSAIKTKEKINEALGGVLFIDEAYSLMNGENDSFGKEAIDTLVEAMTDKMGQFSLIIAGYPKDIEKLIKVNPGFKSRLGYEIEIDDYSPEELTQIFNMNLQRSGYVLDDELTPLIDPFFENWFRARDENWANARNVEDLISKMYGSWCLRNGETTQDNKPIFNRCDIPAELQTHCKPISEAKKDAIEKLNKLVGLSQVKERLNTLRRSIKFSGTVTEPGHYVFAGNPGTGKTTVARLLGDIFCEIGVLRRGHVIEVGREDLVDEHVGGTAPKTKKQLELALDGILFIDEAYRLYEKSDSHNYGKESIDTILAFMENNRDRISVICAGYSKPMDDFIESNEGLKSRFTETIVFEDYNTDELLQILNNFSETEGLILEKDYIEKSRVVFDLWMTNKNSSFGNAREVRKYIKTCKDTLYKRLEEEYPDPDNISENVKKTLTGKDIPSQYLHIVGDRTNV